MSIPFYSLLYLRDNHSYFMSFSLYRSVCKKFNVGHATALRAVRRVCHALHCLASQFITWPQGEKVNITCAEFRTKSAFPAVIGAIDGCHIAINAPKYSDGSYINRKGTHSIQFQVMKVIHSSGDTMVIFFSAIHEYCKRLLLKVLVIFAGCV